MGVGCIRMPTSAHYGQHWCVKATACAFSSCSWQSCFSLLTSGGVKSASELHTNSWMFCKVLQIEDDKVNSGPAHERRVFEKWTRVIPQRRIWSDELGGGPVEPLQPIRGNGGNDLCIPLSSALLWLFLAALFSLVMRRLPTTLLRQNH